MPYNAFTSEMNTSVTIFNFEMIRVSLFLNVQDRYLSTLYSKSYLIGLACTLRINFIDLAYCRQLHLVLIYRKV